MSDVFKDDLNITEKNLSLNIIQELIDLVKIYQKDDVFSDNEFNLYFIYQRDFIKKYDINFNYNLIKKVIFMIFLIITIWII